MQSFLGFADYYRESIKGHSDIVYPMQERIKKGKDFQWTQEAIDAFQKTKNTLCSSPVLALPIDDGRYHVDTDASEVALAGILHQEQSWRGSLHLQPIAYGSKAMSP